MSIQNDFEREIERQKQLESDARFCMLVGLIAGTFAGLLFFLILTFL